MSHKEQEPTDVKDFFDDRATEYHLVSRWATNQTVNFKTDEFISGLSGMVALELGAGTGILISRIRNFKRRIALDISPQMLAQIRDDSIEKVVGDIHNLQFPDRYADLIIARQVLHYCNLPVAFENIRRVLTTSGFLHVVQVVDFEKVPESWDQEWAGFRNVQNRKHLRRAELERSYSENSFRVIRCEYLKVRDEYSWEAFFIKNNIDESKVAQVRRFFEATPEQIAVEIGLRIDEYGIAYNRLFGFWLLRK